MTSTSKLSTAGTMDAKAADQKKAPRSPGPLASSIKLQQQPEEPSCCSQSSITISKQPILALPYQLAGRSALFRNSYEDCVGYTVLPKQPNNGIVGMSAPVIYRSIGCLGFRRIEESSSEATIVASKRKLSLLLLDDPDDTEKNQVSLGIPNCLILRPYVNRMFVLCSKWQLAHSLQQAEERLRQRGQSFLTGSGATFGHGQFTPYTLNMGNKNLETILAEKPGIYLAKPSRGSMGDRLQLVQIRPNRVQADLLSFLTSSQFQRMQSSQVILQRYIERPLLVDKRKFDMRVYMLVVNTRRGGAAEAGRAGGDDRPTAAQSGFFVFMHPGFVRLCSSPYDANNSDLAVHLTNQSIQAKLTKTFGQLKEVTTWYPDELNDYLNKRRRLDRHNWAKDVLYPKVGAILGYVSAVYRYNLDDRDCACNTFRILGVDFLVDDQLRVFLLEFNAYPAWGCQTSVLSDLKPNLWREAVCLSTEVAIRYRNRQPISEKELVTRQNFSIVYSSECVDLARRSVANLYD